MAAAGLRPKKPVRCASPPVRGDAAAESSLPLFSVRALMSMLRLVSGALTSGAFGAASVDGLGALAPGAAAGDGFELSWASAIGTAPTARRRAKSASAKVFITRPPWVFPHSNPDARDGRQV